MTDVIFVRTFIEQKFTTQILPIRRQISTSSNGNCDRSDYDIITSIRTSIFATDLIATMHRVQQSDNNESNHHLTMAIASTNFFLLHIAFTRNMTKISFFRSSCDWECHNTIKSYQLIHHRSISYPATFPIQITSISNYLYFRFFSTT